MSIKCKPQAARIADKNSVAINLKRKFEKKYFLKIFHKFMIKVYLLILCWGFSTFFIVTNDAIK